MTASLDTSFDFTNPQGLAALRGAGDTPEARLAVAKQFESLFLSLMIRQMRQASSVIEGGLIDNDRLEMQQGLFDQQLALSLAQGRGIGLADALMRQFSGPAAARPAGDAGQPLAIVDYAGSGTGAALAARAAKADSAEAATLNGVEDPAPIDLAALTAAPAPAAAAAPAQAPSQLRRAEARALASGVPEEFVAALWPHAERAAARLGTVPDVLIAQAALETGWGRSLPRNQYGESSLNLFGIKAGSDWKGPRAVISTLEFINGVPERRREPFRMYKSVGEAFDDYVALLEARPRYAEALGARSAAGYANALQQGGYATDPDYAKKIIAILARGLPGRETNSDVSQVIARRADSLSGDTRPVNLADGDRT